MMWRLPILRWRMVGLLLVVAFTFRVGMHTPVERLFYALEALYLVVVTVVGGLYLINRLVAARGVFTFDALMLSQLLIVPLGALTAQVCFDQPVFYGMAAQRAYLGLFGLVLVHAGLQRRVISPGDVHRALLWVGWAMLLHWMAAQYVIGPQRYQELGARAGMNPTRGLRIRFDRFLAGYVAIYHMIAFLRRPTWKQTVAAGFMVTYVYLVTLSRIMGVAFAVAIALFAARDTLVSRHRALKYTVLGAAGVVAGVAVLILIPDVGSYVERVFGSAFSVVLTGQESVESSANARIYEVRLITPHILSRPWLGWGAVSKQWDASMASLVGGRFFPKDVGFLGGLFMYGVLGLALCALPYVVYLAKGLLRRCRMSSVSTATPVVFLIYWFVYFLLNNVAPQLPGPGFLALLMVWMTVPALPSTRGGQVG